MIDLLLIVALFNDVSVVFIGVLVCVGLNWSVPVSSVRPRMNIAHLFIAAMHVPCNLDGYIDWEQIGEHYSAVNVTPARLERWDQWCGGCTASERVVFGMHLPVNASMSVLSTRWHRCLLSALLLWLDVLVTWRIIADLVRWRILSTDGVSSRGLFVEFQRLHVKYRPLMMRSVRPLNIPCFYSRRAEPVAV